MTNLSDFFTPKPIQALHGLRTRQISCGDNHYLVAMEGQVQRCHGEDTSDEPQPHMSQASFHLQNLETQRESSEFQYNGVRFDQLSSENLVGEKFETVEVAETFYYAYAKAMGFDVRRDDKRSSTRTGRVTIRKWVCSAQGKRREKDMNNDNRVRAPRKVTRYQCHCLFKIRYFKKPNAYIVVDFRTEHSHHLAQPHESHFLKSHRFVSEGDLALAASMQRVPIRACHTYQYMVDRAGGFGKVGFTIKDLYNKLNSNRQKIVLEGDAKVALSYLDGKAATDEMFFCKYNTYENYRLANLFWRDSASFIDYSCFGDVLVFDSTYKTNVYGKPLVLFAGSNNHLMTTIYGFALQVDEKAETYTWVLETFLEFMKGKKSTTVLTDGCEAMRKAIEIVLPDCPHRLCTWHISKNARTNLRNPELSVEFRKCMFDEVTPYGFERRWNDMVNRFGICDKPWVKMMYDRRHQWAEAFVSGKFLARMRSTQRCEGMSNCVKEYLRTGVKLFELVPLLDTGLARLRNNVLHEDFRSNNSSHEFVTQLRQLEMHASTLYTDSVFYLVREQIERSGGLITKRIMRFRGSHVYVTSRYDNNKENQCTTVYHHLEENPEIVCSCKLFEFEGIPCCHAFNVMKHENMKEIHASLVRKRWTKLAKADFESTVVKDNIPNETLQMIRHGDLSSLGTRVSYLALKTKQGTDILRSELIKLEPVLEEMLNQQKEVCASPSGCNSIIRDPIKVRSKGMQFEGKKQPKTSRKCGLCKNYGHTRPSCPKKNRVRGRLRRVNHMQNQPPKKKQKLG